MRMSLMFAAVTLLTGINLFFIPFQPVPALWGAILAVAFVYGSTTYCNFYSHVKYSPLASSVRVIYVAFCCYTAPDIQPFFD